MMIFFEHIIRWGAPDTNRSHIESELLAFARRPDLFVEGLSDVCLESETHSDDETILRRSTRFGTGYVFSETVTLSSAEGLRIETAPGERHPASTFSIRIEEPEPGVFFLRFVYEQDDSVPANPQIDGLRRQAYLAKDRALVETMLGRLMRS